MKRSSVLLRFGDDPLEVAVRESARARRLTIKVSTDHPPEVVVPVGTGQREIARVLGRNRDWIARKVEELKREAARRPLLGLDHPGVVWVGGEPLPIERRKGSRSVAELRAGRLRVNGPAAEAEGAIRRWYRREARRRLTEVAAREGSRLGLRAERIAVRDARTRWGSCTTRGTLSFSWRLLIAPAEVLEYVVVHELCHLRELNHSPAFWALLAEAYPGWRSRAAWLRNHGWELGEYRPRLAG